MAKLRGNLDYLNGGGVKPKPVVAQKPAAETPEDSLTKDLIKMLTSARQG